MRDLLTATSLLLASTVLCACSATGPADGAAREPFVPAPIPPIQANAARALVDAGITYRPFADVSAPLEVQIEQVRARLDAVPDEAAAPLRLELATLFLGTSLERPDDRQYFLERAESEATEAAFAFGDGTHGAFAAYYVLGQVIGAQGRPDEAVDYFRGIVDGLAASGAQDT